MPQSPFSQEVGSVRSATTPIIRHIPGGVERVPGKNAVRKVFSLGLGRSRSATTPIIRHIPGGVERVPGKNAVRRAFSQRFGDVGRG